MEGKGTTKTNQFSFFDAPLPHYNEQMFIKDPAIIGRQIQRPSRPLGQVSQRYSGKTIKSMAPVVQEVSTGRRLFE